MRGRSGNRPTMSFAQSSVRSWPFDNPTIMAFHNKQCSWMQGLRQMHINTHQYQLAYANLIKTR